jgi:uncharacterized protein (DUF2236 family)
MSRQAGAVRLHDLAIGVGLVAGPANVIMQLARPEVGYGVLESPVDSGKVTLHPIKRARTTFSYLAVALLGTDTERMRYRRAVNTAHAQVRSGPASPVSYDAFDPELQLWVAACLWFGVRDTYWLFGPRRLTPAEWESVYREAAKLGTTLQVPAELWPADLAAFDAYWERELRRVSIDEAVRGYLTDLIMLRHLPAPVRLPLAGLSRFVTTGFLPRPFRIEMDLPWDARRQRRFDRLMRVMALAVRLAPPPLRRFPFNAYLLDVRRRLRTGRPLV